MENGQWVYSCVHHSCKYRCENHMGSNDEQSPSCLTALLPKVWASTSINQVSGYSPEKIIIDLTSKYDTTLDSTLSTLRCILQEGIVYSKVTDAPWYSDANDSWSSSFAVGLCPQ